MDMEALIAGLFLAGATAWMLISGSAGVRRDLWRREDEPQVYWSVVGIGVVGTVVLLVQAIRA